MEMYVIYDRPDDYPEAVVIRQFALGDSGAIPTDKVFGFQTIQMARLAVPPGLVRFERAPGDPPAVVEVWL